MNTTKNFLFISFFYNNMFLSFFFSYHNNTNQPQS